MLRTIYIIVDGHIDARRICAVFSSRQAAEAALRYGDKGAAIEEFFVDAPLPAAAPAGKSLWRVVKQHEYFPVRLNAFSTPAEEQVSQGDEEIEVDVWATDEQEALRLGAERIERFLAAEGQ